MEHKINPAKVLLKDFLALKSLTDDTGCWTEEHLKDNPPRLYRLQRIKSCMAALGMASVSFSDFQNGRFQSFLQKNIGEEILKDLQEVFSLDYSSYIRSKKEEKIPTSYWFKMFLDTRHIIHQFYATRDGVLTASGHYITPVLILDEIQNTIQLQKDTLDKTLCLLMNPKSLTYSRKHLIKYFQFPDIDLCEIDAEWM